jgi:hypothetical protein
MHIRCQVREPYGYVDGTRDATPAQLQAGQALEGPAKAANVDGQVISQVTKGIPRHTFKYGPVEVPMLFALPQMHQSG